MIGKEFCYSMGLLYLYLNTGINEVSINDLNNYLECVKNNLKSINKNNRYNCDIPKYENIYESIYEIKDKEYCVLKSEIDLENIQSYYFGSVPLDVVIASQMPNALDCLGLENKKGSIKLKEEQILSRKK